MGMGILESNLLADEAFAFARHGARFTTDVVCRLLILRFA